MKVIILAGGFGTRLSEYTQDIPKPMVNIGGMPIIWHIMQHYASYGHKDFYLALGYKSQLIKDFFLNYQSLNSDFKINLATGNVKSYVNGGVDWDVSLIDTGEDSMTGGRVKRMEKYIGDEAFMLTYGDGLSNVNLDKLLEFHKSHGKLVTVTATHPSARFGELTIDKGVVTDFKEKPQLNQGWINGGYLIIEPEFFEFITGDNDVLEGAPLEIVAQMGELMAYMHDGFWQCMDTKRDKDALEKLWDAGVAPWVSNR